MTKRVTVDVDEDIVALARVRETISRARAELDEIKRRLLVKGGWKICPPGSPEWEAVITKRQDPAWARKNYAKCEVFIDGKLGDAFFQMSGAWARQEARITRIRRDA